MESLRTLSQIASFLGLFHGSRFGFTEFPALQSPNKFLPVLIEGLSGPRSSLMESLTSRSSVRVNGSRFAIAIHGGVSDSCISIDSAAVKTVLADIIDVAIKRLIHGDNALQVAESAILSLENAPVPVTVEGVSSSEPNVRFSPFTLSHIMVTVPHHPRT
jgi:hypothetical protein